MQKIKLLIQLFKIPAIIFTLGILSRYLHLFNKIPSLDIFFHLAGGAAIAYSLILTLNHWQKKRLIRTKNKTIDFLIIISVVALFAILWEFWEFSMTLLTKTQWQGNLEDTMLDLLMGLTGGTILSVSNLIKKSNL